jgi:hypothetical protein
MMEHGNVSPPPPPTSTPSSNHHHRQHHRPHQQQQQQFDRATLAANTDMVRLLFGVPGTCWGSYACSHARIPGRLYIITTSVLFYSNVFGLERRFCLNFNDIVAMALHRTTSIKFELANDEVYIFRSFVDRHQVLRLLAGLRRLSNKDELQNNNNTNNNSNHHDDASSSMVSLSPQQQQQQQLVRPRSETNRTAPTVSLVDDDADHQQRSLLREDYSTSFRSSANSPSIRFQTPRDPVSLPPNSSTNPFEDDNINDADPLLWPSSAVRVLNRQRANSDSVVRRMLGFEQPDTTIGTPRPEEEGERSLLATHDEHHYRPPLGHTMSAPLLDDISKELDPQTAWELEKAKAFTYENTGVEVCTSDFGFLCLNPAKARQFRVSLCLTYVAIDITKTGCAFKLHTGRLFRIVPSRPSAPFVPSLPDRSHCR